MEERFLVAEPLKATTVTCIPRLRGGARRHRRVASSGGAAPVSVLDRVRDVVLRLAMLSAASTKQGALPQQQTTTTAAAIRTSPGRSAATSRRAAAVRMSPSSAYSDSYRSEAVDECIEFLKRSAAGVGVGVRNSPAAATVGVINSPSPLHACAMCSKYYHC